LAAQYYSVSAFNDVIDAVCFQAPIQPGSLFIAAKLGDVIRSECKKVVNHMV
jgi:hypothetical protein